MGLSKRSTPKPSNLNMLIPKVKSQLYSGILPRSRNPFLARRCQIAELNASSYNSQVEATKIKARKAACKRFALTGAGRIRRRQCGMQHFNEKKKKSRKNSLSTMREVASSDMGNVSKCLALM